ncbi:MAG: methionine--tRNA ligase [Metamycoplasmataceae bacterium]
MEKRKTFYITTPIYYPSGNLHLGHLYSTTIAWAIRNYKIKMGYDVLFGTGSDEHGQKIEKKATELKLSPQKYVDMQSDVFVSFWKDSKIDYDLFSRTTNIKHKEAIEKVFNFLLEKEFIYKGHYNGLYSVNDEEFVSEKDAIAKDNKYYHPTSNHLLELVKEESYFFRMEQFSKWLVEYNIENPEFVIPSKIWLELKKNFIDKKLEDLSITRISFSWGIKINNDPKHVVYVWLDALFSYLTALNWSPDKESPEYLKYWKNGNEIVQVVGKEITRFHCIYWPIFLKALDIKLPTHILSHGWLITPEGKMSKSKGNVINPIDLIDKYDIEIIKYFLISQINIFNDGVFDEQMLITTYNADLANNVGNLVSRVVAMTNQSFNKPVKFGTESEEIDEVMLKKISSSFEEYKSYFDNFQLDKAIGSATNLAKELNKYIDLTAAWLLKDNLKRFEKVLNTLLNGIYAVISMLEVVIPENAQKLLASLNLEYLDFKYINDFHKFDNVKLNYHNIVFNRFKTKV